MFDAVLPCPCGSGLAYVRCCGRWHAGLAAPDAPTLMRSRYSGFVLGLADYLLQTWHPDSRPPSIEFPPDLHWLGLEIRASEQTDADHATVEFVARSKRAGRAMRLHEISRFVRVDGQWLYLDGSLHKPVPLPGRQPKRTA